MKDTYHYNIVFRPEPEGGYTAMVPSLPGCISFGKTLKEAKEMIADAINAYIQSLEKHNEAVPNDSETFFATLDFQHAKTA